MLCNISVINQQKQKLAQRQVPQLPPSLGAAGSPWPPNSQSVQQIQQLTQQMENHKKQAEESIQQSEQNLSAQYQSMIQAQQVNTRAQ